jgi:hypothetical protein
MRGGNDSLMPRLWIAMMAILVLCLLASIVIATIKLA